MGGLGGACLLDLEKAWEAKDRAWQSQEEGLLEEGEVGAGGQEARRS